MIEFIISICIFCFGYMVGTLTTAYLSTMTNSPHHGYQPKAGSELDPRNPPKGSSNVNYGGKHPFRKDNGFVHPFKK